MKWEALENEWKKTLNDTEYQPPALGWSAIQTELHKPSSSSKTKMIIPFLFSYKAAAAACLVLGTTLGTYKLLKNDTKHNAITPSLASYTQEQEKQKPIATTTILQEQSAQSTGTTYVSSIKKVTNLEAPANKIKTYNTENKILQSEVSDDYPLNDIENTNHFPLVSNAKDRNTFLDDRLQPNYKDWEKKNQHKQSNIALVANLGKPNSGNVQYNVGVTVRKDLNDRFFAEAAVSLASTQFNIDEHYKYWAPSDHSSLANNILEEKNATVNYGNAIWAIGVAPAVGYKLTKNIAATVGVDVYKNISNDLRRNVISDPELTKNTTVANAVPVSEWDSGIRAGLEVKLSKNFAINALYRAGINNVISNRTQQLRNNSLQMGVKYYLN